MKTCAVVDAYGPGMNYAGLLKNKGYEIIHIQTTKTVPLPFQDFIAGAGFLDSIVFSEPLEPIISSLKRHDISFIIPGFETGVMAADVISEKLGIKTNGTALSAARRNKSIMMDVLRANSVPTVKYIKTFDNNSAVKWVNENTIYPVIAKPVDSAGSEDVYVCNDANELKQAVNKIINKTNSMGLENKEALIQEFLEGIEYVVNSVSCGGRHYITDMWACKKRIVNGRVIYDREDLISSEGETQSQISNYIYQVLDALGIRYGAAHSELILTKNGPILLETGARIGGAVNPAIHNECFGHNQIELSIDAYMDEKSFSKKITLPYKILQYLYVVMAISHKEGIIKKITFEEDLKKLPSLKYYRLKKKVGDKLNKTIDLNSSPATIYLASEDKTLLEHDYRKILSLVDVGFEIQ